MAPGSQRIPDQVSYHRAMSACGAASFWALAVHLLATMQLGVANDGGLFLGGFHARGVPK